MKPEADYIQTEAGTGGSLCLQGAQVLKISGSSQKLVFANSGLVATFYKVQPPLIMRGAGYGGVCLSIQEGQDLKVLF